MAMVKQIIVKKFSQWQFGYHTK